ncbi:MAG TPA: ABC transporter permease [Bryobacteraceae bacterium]|nr:ABC transporter permease [Bryobacteraceae bacterium]
MATLRQDLLFALRQFRNSPGFALTAIISLALGIGAATAVFSVVYAVLMNPYPYRAPDRLTYMLLRDKAGVDRGTGYTGSQVIELRQVGAVESVLTMDGWNLTTTDGDVPEDVNAIYMTSNASAHLGVPALLGRSLIASDAPDGQDPQPVVVLGYKFWQRYYGGRTDILGRTLNLVHKPYTIVGVMPPRFTWEGADVYLPLKLAADHSYFLSVRLKPGVTYETANAQLQPLLEQFAKQMPNRFPPGFRVHVQGMNYWVRRDLGGSLDLLFAAVALMLLIACSNVSILLLARGAARHQELAIRASIGAGRGQIIRQLLTESLSLALCGALVGVLLAHEIMTLIVKWMPDNLFPSEAQIRINLPVLLFSVAIAVTTGLLFGLWPALHLSRPDLGQVLQSASRRTTGGRGKRTHAILVAAQVALTLILLSGAGQAIAAFRHLLHIALGYDPNHTMSVGIPVHDNTHMRWEDRAQYFEQIRARIGALPGVIGAGISTNATPPLSGMNTSFEIFGQSGVQDHEARTNMVSPEYFTVLHIPLSAGRMWTHTETMRGARLAVVNETLAHRYWPQGNAVGQQIRVPRLKAEPPYSPGVPGGDDWLQVIGVVSDTRDDGLRKPIVPGIYVPYTLTMWMYTQILVRTQGDPLALLMTIRREVRSIDGDQQVMGNVRDLEQWITSEPEWAGERLVALLLTGFSILALALALFGLYSVVSHMVVRRTNEFGLRMALGAQRRDVLGLVFSSTAASVAAGLLAGAVLSLALARFVAIWTQETARDPLILAAVMLLLACSAAAACLAPALRAASTDPMTALRYE